MQKLPLVLVQHFPNYTKLFFFSLTVHFNRVFMILITSRQKLSSSIYLNSAPLLSSILLKNKQINEQTTTQTKKKLGRDDQLFTKNSFSLSLPGLISGFQIPRDVLNLSYLFASCCVHLASCNLCKLNGRDIYHF